VNIQKKFGTPYLFLQPLKLATSNLVCNLGLGLAYKKQRLGPKLAGAWAREASKKMGPPIYFCNRLKNWYTAGLPCQTSFRTKLGRV